MLTVNQRAELVLSEAWRRLPPIKRQMAIAGIYVIDMGEKHGSYSPDDKILTLSDRLFAGENPGQIRLIDIDGNDPPVREPYVGRALATALHECAHAIGTATGLDKASEWLGLSVWVLSDDDPQGTCRYWESRPGWFPHGPSPWRHRDDVFFTRVYAEKSPEEDFADAVAYVALGWARHFETSANGRAKLAYIRKHVWQETGPRAITAARQRWQRRLVGAHV